MSLLRCTDVPRLAFSLALVGLLGCQVDLDAGPQWQIAGPRVLGIETRVVELGPSWPEREGFDPADAPVVEPMPGDRVRLAGMVVDGEGRRVEPEQLDALWFQCFEGDCRLDAPRCDEDPSWTTSSICTLGRGGAFEYVFPPIGLLVGPFDDNWRNAWAVELLAIIARTPEGDAEQCRLGWARGELDLEACTVVEVELPFGPRWVLLHDLALLGVPFDIPLPEIPYAAYLQPANRAPQPEPPVFVDVETGVELEGTPPRLRIGQVAKTKGPRWRPGFDRQTFVNARELEQGSIYVFETEREQVDELPFASAPLQLGADDDGTLLITTSPQAEPGIARLVFVVGDSRQAFALQVNELEVVP